MQVNVDIRTLQAAWRGDRLRPWKANDNGTKEFFLYDGDQIVNELDGNGNVLWSYGVGADGLAQASSSSSSYINYLFDPGGSVTQRQASTSSAPTDVQVYDAFGYRQAVSTVSSPRTNDPVGYKGQWGAYTEKADTPSQALVMGPRTYSPAYGRFTQPFGTSYTPASADPVNDEEDDLGTSGSWGMLYARAGRRGWRDLQRMPEWQPGSKGREFFSMAAEFIPVIGWVKLVQEVVTGQDYVAGTHLSWGRRVFSGALLALPFLRPLASKAKGLFGEGRFFARFLAWLRGGCFVAGTQVACVGEPTKSGSAPPGGSVRYTKANGPPTVTSKPIEQIKAGDLVLARSEKTGAHSVEKAQRFRRKELTDSD